MWGGVGGGGKGSEGLGQRMSMVLGLDRGYLGTLTMIIYAVNYHAFFISRQIFQTVFTTISAFPPDL